MATDFATLLYSTLDSPIGELLLVGDGDSLHGVYMQEGRTPITVRPGWTAAAEPFDAARDQLTEYFDGRRSSFDVPLTLTGTPFQRRVWSALGEIPYGQSISYGELARRIGKPSAPRAVGLANRNNPIAVIVPCHRVIGADGSLTGFGGGVERKRFLLDLEAGAMTLGKSYTLIGADGRPHESPVPGTLGGHRRNKVYGRLDCPGALSWIAKGKYVRQRVFFADEVTAVAAGYRPCATCLPEQYRAWKESRRELHGLGVLSAH